MNASISALLQLATALLLGVQHNAQLPQAVQKNMMALAEQSIQISTQALAPINFPVAQNTSIWPNVVDLENSPFLALDGTWVRQGATVQPMDQYLSFGDMNADGFDDAAVIVKRTDQKGNPHFALAALLNQGGILFNIADIPLGTTLPHISSHHVMNGEVAIDRRHYKLLGNMLIAN